ncbi:molybdenum cofactor guanylyltransferase [Kovacikia minuta]|uniref:molybdenum cofactor guanylyltransferase n=1 Tax=Kovacikia minuta TaxID=2931930 RepID=UPI0020C7624B|nr:molybdenum cofactor guanylyltransferase [Kovacikia minuta]
MVTPRVEQYREILPNHCHFIHEKLLSHETKPQGPLIGFAQGLAEVKTDWVLLLACDLPYLSAEVLQRWSQQLPNLGEAVALLAKTEKDWEPLCGFYRTSCLASLRAEIGRGERSFQRWLSQEVVQPITGGNSPAERRIDARMLFNCNTPTDLATLKGELRLY